MTGELKISLRLYKLSELVDRIFGQRFPEVCGDFHNGVNVLVRSDSDYDASRLPILLTPEVMELRLAMGLPAAPLKLGLDRAQSAELIEETRARLETVPPDLLDCLGLDPANLEPELLEAD